MSFLGISRVEPRIRPLMLRCGFAYMMSGIVEATSLGKMTTDWRMTAVHMSEDRRDLRRFFERASHQRPRRAHHGEQTYATVAGIIAVAQGAVEIVSMGNLTTNWTVQWMCYGEEIIERITGKFREP